MKYPKYPNYKDSGIEWIGEIPEHWNLSKLKYLCSLNADYGVNIKAEDYSDLGVRFLRTTDIDDEGLLTDEGVRVQETLVSENILHDGDILFSRSGSIGRSFLFDGTLHERSAFAGYLVRFRPNKLNEPKFLFYYSKSRLFGAQIASDSIETTIENFNGQKYSNLYVPHPTRNEQSQIVKFLNLETNKINALISKQQKIIQLLKEKRQAIITHAVTKGLDPNVHKKDSGIEWIGEIPEHWKVTPLKFVSLVIMGQSPPSEHYTEAGEIPFLQGCAEFGAVSPDPKHYCEVATKISQPGDILLSVRAPVGEINLSDKVYGIGRGLCAIRSTSSEQGYIKWWLEAAKRELMTVSTGSTYDAVAVDDVKNLKLSIPCSGDEKKIILDFLNLEISKVDSLISKQHQMIELLKEYKTSLISQAVTGKIDVRGLMQEVNEPAGQAP